jgi:hypothetical protein
MVNLSFDDPGKFSRSHRISSRQDATLEELHEMTERVEKLSRAEHDLISDVHPQVSEIKDSRKRWRSYFG